MMYSIHITAVLLAAVAAFILGFLFHGPLLGKYWMKLANIKPTGNEKFADMVPQMLWNMLANIVTALGLSVLYSLASSSPALQGMGVWGGVACGVLAWAGFLVPSTSIDVIWMGRKTSLWLFESACSLVVMAVMGAIIASF
jgi:hypothetical protein